MANFKEGDVVQLKSGGPKMTVQKVTPQGLICVWFITEKGQQKLERATFPETSLQTPPPIAL
jgi:uncharacterized protein YodC (DUF2158 family)